MITPELLAFIQGQLAAGTSREQVADMLLSNGWGAADITNALSQAAPVQPVQPTQPIEPARPVEPVQSMQPMQAAATLPVQTYTEPVYRPVAQSSMQPMQSVQSMQAESAHLAQAQTQATVSHSGWAKSFMVLAGIVVAFAAGWIASQGVTNSRMQTQSVRDAASNQPSPAIQDQASESGAIAPDVPATTTASVASTNPASATSTGATQGPASAVEKDCGTTNGKTPYASDPVLACMGAAALSCSNARATISIGSGGSAQLSTSTLKITNPGSGGACSFTVVPAPAPNASGASASALSISCPLSIVKASDDFLSSATPTWKSPTKTDPNKYAGEIYYYGAMGVFIQNNFSEAKIRAAGCTGDFIKTYIAEHAKLMKMQTH